MNHDLSGPIVREKLSPREFPKLNNNWGDFVSHFPNSYQRKAPLLKKFSIAPFLLAFQALGPFCSLCPKLIIQYSSNPLVCSLTYPTSGLVILLIPFPTLGKPSLHTSTVPILTGFHTHLENQAFGNTFLSLCLKTSCLSLRTQWSNVWNVFGTQTFEELSKSVLGISDDSHQNSGYRYRGK